MIWGLGEVLVGRLALDGKGGSRIERQSRFQVGGDNLEGGSGEC